MIKTKAEYSGIIYNFKCCVPVSQLTVKEREKKKTSEQNLNLILLKMELRSGSDVTG